MCGAKPAAPSNSMSPGGYMDIKQKYTKSTLSRAGLELLILFGSYFLFLQFLQSTGALEKGNFGMAENHSHHSEPFIQPCKPITLVCQCNVLSVSNIDNVPSISRRCTSCSRRIIRCRETLSVWPRKEEEACYCSRSKRNHTSSACSVMRLTVGQCTMSWSTPLWGTLTIPFPLLARLTRSFSSHSS